MNFLLLSYNFSPEPTGIGKYNGELAEYLSGIGHQVTVITGYPYYPQWKVSAGYPKHRYSQEEVFNLRVIRCPLYVPENPSGLKRMLQDFSFLFTSFLALNWLMLQRKRYDVVLAVSPSFLNGLTALWYRLFFRKAKIVYHLQDLQVDAAKDLGLIKFNPLINVLLALENFIFKRVDVISTITEGMLNKIAKRGLYLKQQIIFPNWTEIVKPGFLDASSIHAHFNIPIDARIIFYSGAIGEKQGLEMLFDVAELCKHKIQDAVFIIAGEGPYKDKLKQLSERRALSNLSFIPIQEKHIYLELVQAATVNLVIQKRSASDLVMPSKLATILGAGGIAIISTEKGSTIEKLIEEYGVAVAVEPESPRQLFDAIHQVIAFPTLSADISNRAISYAQNHISKEKVIDAFIDRLSL